MNHEHHEDHDHSPGLLDRRSVSHLGHFDAQGDHDPNDPPQDDDSFLPEMKSQKPGVEMETTSVQMVAEITSTGAILVQAAGTVQTPIQKMDEAVTGGPNGKLRGSWITEEVGGFCLIK